MKNLIISFTCWAFFSLLQACSNDTGSSNYESVDVEQPSSDTANLDKNDTDNMDINLLLIARVQPSIINIDWTALPNADYYQLYYQQPDLGDEILIETLSEVKFQLQTTDLIPYRIWLVAFDAEAQIIAQSSIKTVVPASPNNILQSDSAP